MQGQNLYTDAALLRLFKDGDRSATSHLYRKYYRNLVFFPLEIVHEQLQAEDIVQEAFVKLWQGRNKINSLPELKSYLYVSVKNASLNILERQSVRDKGVDTIRRLLYKEGGEYIESRMMFRANGQIRGNY